MMPFPLNWPSQHMDLFRQHKLKSELIVVLEGVPGVVNWENDERFQAYKPKLINGLNQLLAR